MLYESSQLAQGPLGSTCLSRAHPCPGEAAPPTTVALRSGPVSHTQASSVVASGGSRASSSLSRVKTLSGVSGVHVPRTSVGGRAAPPWLAAAQTPEWTVACVAREMPTNRGADRFLDKSFPCLRFCGCRQTCFLLQFHPSLASLFCLSVLKEKRREAGREPAALQWSSTEPFLTGLSFALLEGFWGYHELYF